jgi:hypothetical protein
MRASDPKQAKERTGRQLAPTPVTGARRTTALGAKARSDPTGSASTRVVLSSPRRTSLQAPMMVRWVVRVDDG